MKQPKDMCMISVTDIVNKDIMVVPIKKRLRIEELVTFIMNLEVDDINGYDDI